MAAWREFTSNDGQGGFVARLAVAESDSRRLGLVHLSVYSGMHKPRPSLGGRGEDVVSVSAKLGLVPISRRIVDLAPLAMMAYAGYEAACIFRDGCFGHASPIGLRPPGLSTTPVPIGWFMAAAVAAAAVVVHPLAARRHPPEVVVVVDVAVLAVAAVRALGSIWLPDVGDGRTRQHLTSIAVAAIAAVAIEVSLARTSLRPPDRVPRARRPPDQGVTKR